MLDRNADGSLLNGQKHGLWITWFANGNKRSEGHYEHGKKQGLWVQYYKNGNRASESTFRDGLFSGTTTRWYPNGNLESVVTFGPHQGNSYDGKKEGEAYSYEEDGETIWRIITYKHGARAKEDDYPQGICPECHHPRRQAHKETCPNCQAPL